MAHSWCSCDSHDHEFQARTIKMVQLWEQHERSNSGEWLGVSPPSKSLM